MKNWSIHIVKLSNGYTYTVYSNWVTTGYLVTTSKRKYQKGIATSYGQALSRAQAFIKKEEKELEAENATT